MDFSQLQLFAMPGVHGELYIQLLILLGTSTFLILAMQRLRLSPILGYMLAGVVIGPSVFGFINDPHDLEPVAELGIACMLFVIGLELSWSRLKSMRQLVIGFGGIQCVLTAIIIAGLLVLTGQKLFTAALIGFAFALSSTAIVLQLLAERGEVRTRTGRVAFAALLFQDLAAIPLLAIATAGTVPENAMMVVIAITKAMVALGVILGVAHFVSYPILRRIAGTRNNELFTAFTLFVVIGMGVATQMAGLSLSLGAFLAGLLLSGTAYRHKVEADIAPFKALLLGLFFMTVGMNLNLALIEKHFLLVITSVIVLVAIKGTIIYIMARYFFGKSHAGARRLAVWLAGAGEFALVVVQAMQTSKFLALENAQILLAIAVLSLVLTPLLNTLDHWWEQRKAKSTAVPVVPQPVLVTTPQIVIVGFTRVGMMVAQELKRAGIDYIALEGDATIVAKAQSKGEPVYFGAADDPNLMQQLDLGHKQALIIALDNPRQATSVVASVREQWRELPILARAYDQEHAKRLQDSGANVTVTETLAASIALAEAAIVLAEDDIEVKPVAANVSEPTAPAEIPHG